MANTFTKLELARALTQRAGLQLNEATRLADTLLDILAEAFTQCDRVELRGFGVFATRTRAARKGRNPKTGEAVDVPAKREVKFKAGKELREKLNEHLATH